MMPAAHSYRRTFKWQNYGLGYSLYQDSTIATVGHSGGVAGYTANFIFEKESKYGVILMRNYNFGNGHLNHRSVSLMRKLRALEAIQMKYKENNQ